MDRHRAPLNTLGSFPLDFFLNNASLCAYLKFLYVSDTTTLLAYSQIQSENSLASSDHHFPTPAVQFKTLGTIQ